MQSNKINSKVKSIFHCFFYWKHTTWIILRTFANGNSYEMNSILNWDNTVLSIKMKRQLILLVMLFVCIASIAQKKFSVYAIGFYNQENLFDTCHDAGK